VQEHGYAPTQREIAQHCGIRLSAVGLHLDRLEIWRWIRRTAGKARSIVILNAAAGGQPQLPVALPSIGETSLPSPVDGD
jgi:SOS-response transcriptional repressor LexA